MKNITICNYHPQQVPLISTFAFMGAEQWCPFCGNCSDIFGGKSVEATEELEERLKRYEEASDEYLTARGMAVCSSLMWEGKRISPRELPQEEKDRIQKIIDAGWKTGVFIE